MITTTQLKKQKNLISIAVSLLSTIIACLVTSTGRITSIKQLYQTTKIQVDRLQDTGV